ncbi:MAG: peptidase S41, partial [Planctomycetota bacterium]|nr:peptidase S41 [Planctomycetota bacterium]
MNIAVSRSLLAGAAMALPAVFAHADVNPNAGMLRNPDVSSTHVVFRYANDLWLVSREGGVATPLASPAGAESSPKFSDDGQTIAFVGNYDGNTDLYTLSINGGLPTRVTHHPARESLSGWTPDGKLIFSSSGMSGLGRAPRIFTVSADGGLPEPLPVPYGMAGTISDDGEWLAYTPHNRDGRTWKRYRGGMASDVWLLNLHSFTSDKITDWEGTDTLPMWKGDKIYYLSDGGDEHRLNIWCYDTKTEKRNQITHFKGFDVKWPSIGPGGQGQGEIVFQNGSSLYLLDLRTKQSRKVNVTIPGDRPSIRTKSVDASKFIQSWGISSTGKRATMQARGDIWTAPVDKGEPRNLTSTSGVAEREPTWSPDGRWIAYFADNTGEYELYMMQSDGKGETIQLTDDGGPFKSNIYWSPDSKKILFNDKTGAFYLLDVESKSINQFDHDPIIVGSTSFSWSHDSRWIAYDKPDETNIFSSIWIYNVEDDETRRVTSSMFSDTNPTFDRKGDYLYFVSARSSFTPVYSDLPNDSTFVYKGSEVLLAVPLREDMDYVWAPQSDEESWDDEEAEEDSEEDDDEEQTSEDDDEQTPEDDGEQTPAADDGVSGTWEGIVEIPDMGAVDMSLTLTLNSDGSLNATMSTAMFSGS